MGPRCYILPLGRGLTVALEAGIRPNMHLSAIDPRHREYLAHHRCPTRKGLFVKRCARSGL